jgi:hypothetical protein
MTLAFIYGTNWSPQKDQTKENITNKDKNYANRIPNGADDDD